MSAIKDGGPAFPSTEEHPNYDIPMHFHGMSLRDWFAGKADTDLTMEYAEALNGPFFPDRTPTTLEVMQWWAVANAKARYLVADAMIAEREKGGAE